MARCWWSDTDDLLRVYHDEEWGRPVASDRVLFEKLSLEGFQSGLSWLTILRKREHFRAAFLDFEPSVVARFGARDVTRLLRDVRIVRNRAKIAATINNARRLADLVGDFGSFAAYAWRYEVKRRGLQDWDSIVQAGPSAEAIAMSKDLRKRGWAFVGPTTVHSFMEAKGLINDHVRGCATGREVEKLRREFVRPK